MTGINSPEFARIFRTIEKIQKDARKVRSFIEFENFFWNVITFIRNLYFDSMSIFW